MGTLYTKFTRKLFFTFLFFTILNNTISAQTTLVAGDIAFTGYISAVATTDEFSFVLLKPVTSGTVINFTDNGWLNTNVFRTGEQIVTWTSTAALAAGTEIKISGPGAGTATATLVGGASAGTCAGSMPSLSTSGDQVLAYQGTVAAPTFISAIHMNVYSVANFDPVNTDAATWDNTNSNNTSASALPPGLTTGTTAIWVGTFNTAASEFDNAIFNCAAGLIGTVAQIKAIIYDPNNWTKTNGTPVLPMATPTGCNFLNVLSAPSITGHPANASICAGVNTSFTITATGALSYQWQVDPGTGFVNVTDNATYSGSATTTLSITATPFSFNSNTYRCVATNGTGSTNSNNATLTVSALPTNPTLLAKTPTTVTVADGTPVSATFNPGSGGTGCSDDYRYTTNGGTSYLPYTAGSNISTTGVAAGTGMAVIEGRRNNCSSACTNNYVVLASWVVTPLPATATTLNAGDIAFTGYTSTTAGDDFSFVLLRNIGSGTVINFTDNGWLSTNALQTGETTITWTSNAAYSAGTEIKISGTTATLAAGGSAGTVTGTALSLSTSGDQILAYRGTAASPTFISAIHMNVYSVSAGDPVTTTAAAWDGTANTASSSALPTGLTTGVNCIWVGTQGVPASEFANSFYGNCGGPGTLGPIATLRATLNNQANWISDNGTPPSFALPTGCSYLGVGSLPNITGQPANTAVCEGSNASFTLTAGGATSYQWQVDPGTGFVNVTNNTIYSGATTATLNITTAPFSINNTQYRCVLTNGSGSVTSNGASLTLTPLATAPTLLAKIPANVSAADGTSVSATFNAGAGGAICTDDFRYTIDGGVTYLPYTPGSNISTTGLAAGIGYVFIEGRRAGCSGILACDAAYRVLASWYITPLPVAATTLNAGDIAFSGYNSTATPDEFSFVLLRNVGPSTTINFTDNGWLSTNALQSAEQTITWTAPAGGLTAGVEIKIAGLTATRSGGGAAGTIAGTALSLSSSGDQILAYIGTAASPTFISAIHMNVYSTTNGDPITTTAAAWDGTANTQSSSALPTGLTTGINCIWIGSQGVTTSEHNNAKYGVCNLPAVAGSIALLRAALNNQANWTVDDKTPPGLTLPAGCNFLNVLIPSINVTGTPLTTFTACAGTASAEQNFTVSGSALTANISITAPAGFEISTTSGSGFTSSVSLTQSGGSLPNTIIYVRMASSATGTPSGNITITSSGATTVNVAVSGTVNPLPLTPTITPGGPTTFCTGGSVTLTSSSATGNLWSTGETTQSIIVTTAGTYTVTVTTGGCTSAPSAGTTVTVNPLPATPTITAGGPTTFCTGGSVVLTSSSATGNLWSTGETTQSITASIAATYTVTVTISGCTSASSAGTTITLDPLPTTANAGPDATACVSPGTFTMAANLPTVGSGVWSQVPGGPSTAIISTTGSATSNITGLSTPGVYTFVWSISNGTCSPSRDTMTITVNANPLPFTLNGGGTFCPGTTTLTGPTDPNYSYTWQHSLSGIANPNSFTTFGGSAQTQDVNSSGNYRLIVTNQFGCTISDTASVSMADYVFNGSLATGDATQTGRLNRFAAVSTCAAPNACPGTFTTTGARLYDSYTINNPRSVPVCATIGIASGCGVNMFSEAYSGSFNPSSLCTNYLADPGSSFPNVGYYEATIPANSSIVVLVSEVNVGTGCANYQLTVDVPRDLSVVTATPPSVPFNGTSLLAAPPANTYSWSPGAGNTQSINSNPITGTTKYYVTMGYGNAGCTRLDSVTVNLSCTAPSVTCPANINLNNATNTCGRVVNYTTTLGGSPVPTINYAFTGATTASGLGDGSGSNFNVGVTNVTVTATNTCGSTNCSFTVTITDNQAPAVTVGIIGSCYPTVAAAQAAALAATSATDNCPGALTETASTVGNCSAVVTVRTTDIAGNFTDVTYNTRIDNTPPTVTCPNSITVCGSAAVPVPNIAMVSVTDNCPGVITITFIGDVSTPSTSSPYNIIRTYRATDGCGNFAECTQIITVNPTATVTPIANKVVCNGSLTGAVNFTSPTTGGSIVYNWTNNTTSIGLAASGTGNIPSFTATNATNGPVTATITVTPSYTNGGIICIGTPMIFTITVNPIPQVNQPTNQVVCNNTSFATTNFTTPTTGGVILYSWANSNAAIGLGASGTGNIPAFTGANANNAPDVATVAVTPLIITESSSALAVYPLETGLAEATGNFGNVLLQGNPTPPTVPSAGNPLCQNGAYIVNSNGQNVVTPNISTLDPANFTLSVDFRISAFGLQPVIMGGSSFRWIGIYMSGNNIGMKWNNSSTAFSGTTLNLNQWYNAKIIFTNNTAYLLLDGNLIQTQATGVLTTGNNFNFTTTDFSNARAFNGCIRNLVISGTQTCTGGTPKTFSYTVNPTATVNAIPNQVLCNNSPSTAVTFGTTATGGTVVYNWTNNTTSIGLAASGTGNIPSFTATNTATSPVTATITVTPTFTNGGVSCVGTPITYTYTVNPTATVNAVTNQVLCNNSPSTAVTFSTTSTGGTVVYNWTNNTTFIGLAASGTGNIASFTAINTGTAPVVATITVTPSYTNGGLTCVGTPTTYTYTVNPTATVTPVTSQVICNGSPTTAVTFSSPTTGGTIVYNWTNNTPSIGLAATGSGNIASFTATNAGTAPVIATITVTPSYTNGGVTCVGTATTYTYTVNPTATVNVVANQVVCNLSPTTAVTFSSPTTGGTIVYNWTNTTTSIGLAASGIGNIASFTATNTTTAPVTATITVTPSYTNAGVTCVGTPRTFTITVNPTATVNPVANQVLCNNFPTTAVTFTSPTTGGTIVYNWTNNTTSIGLAASGTGNIASFTATNTTQVPVAATITVTPSYTNGGVTCVGTPLTFTITVNPTPIVTLAPFAAICKNAAPITLTGGSPVAGPGTTGVYLVDNVAQTIFNPANYTPGLHTIVYVYTNQFGCVNSATQTILVYPIHTVEITVTPSRAASPGAPATVVATVSPADNYTYVWSKNNSVTPTLPNADRIVVLANDAGNYSVKVIAPTGCVVNSSVVFTPSDIIPQTLFIFPNPNSGVFNVSYNDGGANLNNRVLTVYDAKGATVFVKSYSVNVPYGNMSVDMSKSASGQYYVILTDSTGKKLATATVQKL